MSNYHKSMPIKIPSSTVNSNSNNLNNSNFNYTTNSRMTMNSRCLNGSLFGVIFVYLIVSLYSLNLFIQSVD